MNQPTALLLLPRLKVQGANAISGPLSWGFPSPTAFIGFTHALERHFSNELRDGFGGVGIVCHRFDPKISKPPGRRTLVFNLTRNPLRKDGKPSAFVEEGRANMEVSLLIAVRDYMPQREGEYFADDILERVQTMRLAGGSLLPQRQDRRYHPQWWPFAEDEQGQTELLRKIGRKMLPGFALVQREDVLATHIEQMRLKQDQVTALDALVDLARLNIEPDTPDLEEPGKYGWGIRRKPGWLVPLPVGYAALSPVYEPNSVKNARDDSSEFRFVESLYSLGEWISPHRIERLEQLLWYPSADPKNGIYICKNHFSKNLIAD
jgi:CRISPR-associated protein Csy2